MGTRLFEEFDNSVNRFVDTYRSAHKAERMGRNINGLRGTNSLLELPTTLNTNPTNGLGVRRFMKALGRIPYAILIHPVC